MIPVLPLDVSCSEIIVSPSLKGITADKKIINYLVQLIILNDHSKFYQLEQKR